MSDHDGIQRKFQQLAESMRDVIEIIAELQSDISRMDEEGSGSAAGGDGAAQGGSDPDRPAAGPSPGPAEGQLRNPSALPFPFPSPPQGSAPSAYPATFGWTWSACAPGYAFPNGPLYAVWPPPCPAGYRCAGGYWGGWSRSAEGSWVWRWGRGDGHEAHAGAAARTPGGPSPDDRRDG